MTTPVRSCILALGLLSVGCSGDSGSLPRCQKSADCDSGLVCLVPVDGESGVCASPPFGVGLIEPAPGANVGGAGVTVTAQVSVAGPGGKAPDDVLMVVNGADGSSLTLTGRDGAILTYQGKYVPRAGAPQAVTLWVSARTSAGSVPSDAVILVVDAKAPALFLATAGCAPLCRRDEKMRVAVQVDDEHAVSVDASLDLDGYATPVPLGATGNGHEYEARIPLKDLPFPRFSGTVSARIRARDTFGNESVADVPPVPVTRLRWVYDAKADGISSPALNSDGQVLLGVAGTTDQLRSVGPDGKELWRMTLGGKGVDAAPSIGPNALWVGSEDGDLYGRKLDGTLLTCPAQGQRTPGSLFTPAIRLDPAEAAYTAGSAKNLYGAAPAGCFPSPASTGDAVTTSPVIAGGKVFVATSAATVKHFTDALAQDGFEITPFGDGVFCSDITVPMTVTADGKLVLACGIGQGKSQIHRIDPASGASSYLRTLPSKPAESIVILPGGDLAVGTNDGRLYRLTPPTTGGSDPWTDAWSPPPDLGAAVTGVLVATPEQGGQGAVVYAVTESGTLHALNAQGATVWSTRDDASSPLGNFSLRFPTIAPAQPGELPTLYVGSAEGKLYAVVVDTGLDASSPWPKSHHDLRNTGNASAPLP